MKHKKHLEFRMKSIRKAKHHSKQNGKAGSGENNKHTAVQLQSFCLPGGLTYCSSFSENPNIFNILQLEEELVRVEPCSHFHSCNCSLYPHASMKTSKIFNQKPQISRQTKKNPNQKTPKHFCIKQLSKFAMETESRKFSISFCLRKLQHRYFASSQDSVGS